MIHQDTATILQAQWAEIGVDVTLEEVDAGALFDRYLRATRSAIPLPHFTADVTVNDEVATLFWDNNPENVIRAFATGWEVPQEMVDLTQEAAGDRRGAANGDVAQVQQMAMDNAPWVTLFFIPSVTAVRDGVEGFQTLPNAWWDLEDVWLDR